MSLMKSIFTFSFFVLTAMACQTIPLYEQVTIHPEHQWESKEVKGYTFNIDDTTASYKIYFVIRHHNAYHYKNIWIQLNTSAPNTPMVKQSYNLPLADDLKGWLGVGMDDIFDQRIPLSPTPIKFKKGQYTFSVQHTMREDPLQNVLSTGIRVEKIK